MLSAYDAVLLIAFGGPISPEEIRPFLSQVLRNHPAPLDRIEEVVQHYMAVGGRSPLNEITFRQAGALEKVLRQRGSHLPVYVGMRNAPPFLHETLGEMTADGVRRALAFILSPHQTEASWQRYQRDVELAQEKLGTAPEIKFCPGWHDHPRFIEVLSEQIRPCLAKIPPENRAETRLIFTAHSVPVGMAAESPYVSQIHETSRLAAEYLSHPRWSVAYQSRSGRPGERWLEPDIGAAIITLPNEGVTDVVVAPVGFVCDHVEVLYDLDVEAKQIAESLGINFIRASCANDHPVFILMMADVIETSAKS